MARINQQTPVPPTLGTGTAQQTISQLEEMGKRANQSMEAFRQQILNPSPTFQQRMTALGQSVAGVGTPQFQTPGAIQEGMQDRQAQRLGQLAQFDLSNFDNQQKLVSAMADRGDKLAQWLRSQVNNAQEALGQNNPELLGELQNRVSQAMTALPSGAGLEAVGLFGPIFDDVLGRAKTKPQRSDIVTLESADPEVQSRSFNWNDPAQRAEANKLIKTGQWSKRQGGGTTVNLPGEKPFAEFAIDEFQRITEQGSASRLKLADIETADSALDTIGTNAVAKTYLGFKRFFTAFGLGDDFDRTVAPAISPNGEVANMELFKQLSGRFAMERVEQFKGSTSEKELRFAEMIVTNVGNSRIGNRMYLNLVRATEQYKVQQNVIMNDEFMKHVRGGGNPADITWYTNYLDRWQSFLQNNDIADIVRDTYSEVTFGDIAFEVTQNGLPEPRLQWEPPLKAGAPPRIFVNMPNAMGTPTPGLDMSKFYVRWDSIPPETRQRVMEAMGNQQ